MNYVEEIDVAVLSMDEILNMVGLGTWAPVDERDLLGDFGAGHEEMPVDLYIRLQDA